MGLYLSYSKNIYRRRVKEVFFFKAMSVFSVANKTTTELLNNIEPKITNVITFINECASNNNSDNYEIVLNDSLNEQDLKNLLQYLSNYLLDKEISIGLLTTNKRFIDDHYELFDSYGVTTAPTITFSHGTNILKCCAVEVDTPKREPSKVNARFRRSVNKPNTIKLKESFHDQLLKLIIESGKDNADIYKDSGITRQVFSKIMCTPTLIPKKETIICLCIGLELSLNQSLELLNAAGYTLSESIMLDSIVMKYLADEIYDLDFINSELDEFNCPLLGWHPRDD